MLVWFHPESTMDELICTWLAELCGEQVVMQVDSLAAEHTDCLRKQHFVRGQAKHTIGRPGPPRCAPG